VLRFLNKIYFIPVRELQKRSVTTKKGLEFPYRDRFAIHKVASWYNEKDVEVACVHYCHPLRSKLMFLISFELKKGEVLSFAGLVGSGRTELLRAVFGADKIDSGKFSLNGKEIKINSPINAIEHGIALLNEDRKEEGLFLNISIAENISAAKLDSITKLGFLQKSAEKNAARKFVDDLSVKTPDINQLCINLMWILSSS